MTKKVLSVMLVFLMCLNLFSGAVSAADEGVAYLTYEKSGFKTAYCKAYTQLSLDTIYTDGTLSGSWYVLTGGTAHGRVTFSGDVSVILLNDADCYFPYGIGLHDGSTLRIYAQPAESGKSTGKLRTGNSGGESAGYDTTVGGAGIGGDYTIGSKKDVSCGNLYIYGGILDVKGRKNAAGIGGSGYSTGENSNVCGNGGKV